MMTDTQMMSCYKPAYLGRRICAGFIDAILYTVYYIIILAWMIPAPNEIDMGYEYEDNFGDVCNLNLTIPQTFLEYMVAVLLPIVFYTCCFIQWGASIGKMCLGIYIIDQTTGQPPHARQYITRMMTIDFVLLHITLFSCSTFGSDFNFVGPKIHASHMYSFLTCLYIGYILIDRQHRAVHDIIANTVVVQNNKKHFDKTAAIL